MPTLSKPLTLAKANDAVLGAFSPVPPSETLDHLVRYLSTWSGSDKFFMIIQYAVKLIVPLLNLRARLQHRTGLRKDPTSSAAQGWTNLASVVSDGRVLWRIWGLLPIFQWLVSLERTPPTTRKQLTIERLQGWSMLAYYPLEHLYYLRAHEVIPPTLPTPSSILAKFLSSKSNTKSSSTPRLNLDLTALSVWSCRFWALYVLLQFAHLKEDRQLLKLKEKVVGRGKGKASEKEEKELKGAWDAWWNEVVVNVGYLPLTVHWSLEKGLFHNEIWVGVFGLIAAIAQFRSGWKATALPSSSSPSSEDAIKPAGEVEGETAALEGEI